MSLVNEILCSSYVHDPNAIQFTERGDNLHIYITKSTILRCLDKIYNSKILFYDEYIDVDTIYNSIRVRYTEISNWSTSDDHMFIFHCEGQISIYGDSEIIVLLNKCMEEKIIGCLIRRGYAMSYRDGYNLFHRIVIEANSNDD